jgi:hypothetical protein
VDETLHVVEDLLETHGGRVEALYVTGGGSEMPIVSRILREKFGKRVRRSMHARAATAIGLAIQADQQAGYVLREKFTRFFGVWREDEGGLRVVFDPLFNKGTARPGPGERPLEIRRSYTPVHNVGHFRYLECSHLGDDGHPCGEVAVWDEIRFPFDPALRDVESVSVVHCESARAQAVEERYRVDASGSVSVRITNLAAGYQREYRLGRWASKDAPVIPGKMRMRHATRKPAEGRRR